jgi:hypothetical protein
VTKATDAANELDALATALHGEDVAGSLAAVAATGRSGGNDAAPPASMQGYRDALTHLLGALEPCKPAA